MRFENFVENAQPKGRRHVAGQLADAAQHHHQKRVDDVSLTQFRPDVAKLRQRHAAQPGNTGAEAKGQHIHPPGRHAAAGGHRPVLRHGADVHPQTGAVQDEPGKAQHQQDERQYRQPVPRQDQVRQDLHAAGEPGRVCHLHVLRAKQHPHQLDKHQADPPGGEQRFQRPTIQMTNNGALQRHADPGGHQKRHRQRDQRIKGQPLRRELRQRLLYQPAAVGADH